MTFIIKDRVFAYSNSTGASNFVLEATKLGYRNWSDIGDTNSTYYTIVADNGDWEVGQGIYLAANNELQRVKVYSNSQGNQNKIVFDTGLKEVFCGLPAEEFNRTLKKDLNLSDLTDFAQARANLGFGSAAVSDVVQTTGNSTVDVMSQDAVTTELFAIAQDINNIKSYVSVREFGAKGDGVTDDTAAIQAAIDSASSLFWPEGDYKVTASLSDFWDRVHAGYGKITRGGETFYITPRGDETNILYSGAPHSRTTDGFTSDESIHIDEAIKRIRTIGNKAQDGIWRIQMIGTTEASGVTLEGLPVFKNRLEIWGQAADDVSAVPTVVWDGTSSGRNYAIRGDWNYNSANFFLHFKNIKFTNWNKGTNAGAIVIWGSGDVLSENIHVDNCSIGEWYRQNYSRTVGGRADNCQTLGVGIQYSASGNVGNLSGKGKVFTNCKVGVSVGRNSTVYIQGCDMSGESLIEVNRNSRIRTQGNIFRSWDLCVVDASLVGVWTVDNGQGSPDTYMQIPSGTKPVMRCSSGSIHQLIQRYSGNTHLINPTGSSASITGTTTATLISTAVGVLPGEWVPARVPAWWAYSPSARLTVKLFMSHITPHSGGTLELKGGGSSASLLLCSLTVEPSGVSQAGWITLEFMTRGSASTGRYFAEYKSNQGYIVNTGSTSSLNNALIRDASEKVLLYRLYWTPNDSNDTVLFMDMHSYIEV